MLEIAHSKEVSLSDIMLQVQGAQEFPISVTVGSGTAHIKDKDAAQMFSLGIMMALDAKEATKGTTAKAATVYEGTDFDIRIELIPEMSVRAVGVCKGLGINTLRELLAYIYTHGEEALVRRNCGHLTQKILSTIYKHYEDLLYRQALGLPGALSSNGGSHHG